jgi:anti-sigma regulatory factor (Ser/Thr protein kinase)
MDDARVEDLRIAVSEATANAVLAHQRAARPSPVVLTFGPSGRGSFEVTIADAGLDVVGEYAEYPGPEAGLAVILIQGLVDEVRLSPGDVSPTVTLAVGLGAPAPARDGAEAYEVQAPAR